MKTTFYKKRINSVLKTLNQQSGSSALLLTSAAATQKSRDTHYPYSQDRDFLYLTGCNDPGVALLVSSENKKPTLIVPKADKMRILWEGPLYEIDLALKNCGAELVEASNVKAEVIKRLRGIETLYYQNNPSTISWEISEQLMKTPSHERFNLPSKFSHSDALLLEMRLHKDAEEIKAIESAIDISFAAWRSALPLVMAGTKESQLSCTVDYGFRMMDAEVAFSTIIATGKNAAVLHYHKQQDLLKKSDLVLFDFGASFNGYAADISRTVPVSGKFNSQQAELYDIVLKAQKAAISKIKDGVLISTVYKAAAKVITEGLVELKVLKGKTSTLLEKAAFKPYFAHGIGHSLGMDVHDIGNHRGNNNATLHTGMVFTVEPGIYFNKKIGKVPACGIRIEDDILVTKNGCKVLSNNIPKERNEIEDLMAF